ncbi:ABC transporter substrate-binding protein [Bacillus sp. M6-12]|uniref:ABC transporter substrate-binding protein n=1 Tax=Bacillus sp. M6-12 TaxID=2054166 RepID=UPI000C76CEDF|nr:ABC transporter substrate-binding protein [Bacillus sp. M6-12]PLS17052.1 ABC transporter substrate-binding protein [Bacillus sp. M6-12]
MAFRKSSTYKMIAILILILNMLLLSACGGAATGGKASASKDTVKIGVILSQTGPFSALAENIKNGFELYLEQNGNKLGGKKVEVKYEDDEGNPQVALRKYRQLVKSEKIDVLVAPILSSVAYALRDEVVKDKIIMIIPNAAANDISWEQKSDYIYRVSLSNWQNGTNAASYIAENLGKTAVTVANDYAAGKEEIAAFKAAFESSGGKVIKEIYSKIGTNDYAPYVTEIAKEKPDVVYSFLSGNDAIRLVQQYSDFGLKGKIQFTGAWEFGDMLVIEPSGDAIEGVVSGVLYTPMLENELNKKFVADYQKKYNKTPSTFSVEGYDSAIVIDKAIKEAGGTDAEKMIPVLKGITWDSPRGQITMDEKTNNPIQDFYIVKNVKKDNKIIPEVLETVEKVTMPESAPK